MYFHQSKALKFGTIFISKGTLHKQTLFYCEGYTKKSGYSFTVRNFIQADKPGALQFKHHAVAFFYFYHFVQR